MTIGREEKKLDKFFINIHSVCYNFVPFRPSTHSLSDRLQIDLTIYQVVGASRAAVVLLSR